MSKMRFYGEGLFNTPFEIRKWKIGWRFPFVHKVIVWKGTAKDAQKLINIANRLRIESPPKKKSGEIETNVPIHGVKKGKK